MALPNTRVICNSPRIWLKMSRIIPVSLSRSAMVIRCYSADPAPPPPRNPRLPQNDQPSIFKELHFGSIKPESPKYSGPTPPGVNPMGTYTPGVNPQHANSPANRPPEGLARNVQSPPSVTVQGQGKDRIKAKKEASATNYDDRTFPPETPAF